MKRSDVAMMRLKVIDTGFREKTDRNIFFMITAPNGLWLVVEKLKYAHGNGLSPWNVEVYGFTL
jgi:hypothetical protein